MAETQPIPRADVVLISALLKWAVRLAGEGFTEPEQFLSDYSQATGNENWDALADNFATHAERYMAMGEALQWIETFADVRSKDDSKTFARVNRGALRTIRDRAAEALRIRQAA